MKVVVSMVTATGLMKRCDAALIFNLEHMLNLQMKPQKQLHLCGPCRDKRCTFHFEDESSLPFSFFFVGVLFFLNNKAGGDANLRQ